MNAAVELAPLVGIVLACVALGVSRATYYRLHRAAVTPPTHPPRAPSALALSGSERQAILDVLHAPEHLDSSPRTVYAKLLDAGHYLGSVSTMYRVLRDAVRCAGAAPSVPILCSWRSKSAFIWRTRLTAGSA